jgi:hypothetical protein
MEAFKSIKGTNLGVAMDVGCVGHAPMVAMEAECGSGVGCYGTIWFPATEASVPSRTES